MRNIFLITFVALAIHANAQQDTSYWSTKVKGTINFTQTSLSNWAGGGDNSLSLNNYLGFVANYRKGKSLWENTLDLGYGIVKQSGEELRKTDDRILLISIYGRQVSKDSSLFWSSGFEFRTQFDEGFAFPDDSTVISRFMAPGYLLVSSGLDFRPRDNFSLFFSPVTGKFTFVNDDALSANGAFGVDPGSKSRSELGTSVNVWYKSELVENVTFESKLNLFTNYSENFGNIDVNWEALLLLKINDFLATSLVTQLIYDDDVKVPLFDENDVKTGDGRRVQFKEIFGIGINFSF